MTKTTKKKSVKKKATKKKAGGKRPLSLQQRLFTEEYIKDFNGKQAAIRAGYSPRTAESQASRLLRNVKIKSLVLKAKKQRIKEVKTDATWILKRLREELDADIADIYDKDTNKLKPIHEWPKIFRTGLTVGIDVTRTGFGDDDDYEEVTKVRLPDKLGRTIAAGKHVDVRAFEEVHRHEAGETIIEAMEKARERAAEAAKNNS